ncbi:Bromodomain containing protein [Histomonas meleagridis]|nr:Bromodomain containing protein [Histomonas meleagridis]
MEEPLGKCLIEYGADEIPDEVLPTLTNLKVIQERLQRNQYNTIEDWDRDVQMILYNVEKYYGNNSYFFIVAQQFTHYFNKQKEKVYRLGIEGWTRQFINLQLKISDLISKPPPSVSKNYPKTFLKSIKPQEFSENDLTSLLEDIKKLPKQKSNDLLFFNNVFRHYDTELDIFNEPLRVDLRKLPVEALTEIKKYVHKRIEETSKNTEKEHVSH